MGETKMMPKRKIWWHTGAGEFTLWDHYYFSILLHTLHPFVQKTETLNVDWSRGDYIILNYPEKPLTTDQQKNLDKALERGAHIFFLAYYQNEDGVAEITNSYISRFGLELNYGEVRDPQFCHDNDPLLPIVKGVQPPFTHLKVLFPCTTYIQMHERTRVESLLVTQSSSLPVVCKVPVYQGTITVFGTCVFWDNFSIKLYDNMRFVEYLFHLSES